MNSKPICVIFSSGAYACMIQDDMRNEHFESIYGITISEKTQTLEEQYEKEYLWDYLEVDLIGTGDAERRYLSIMEKRTEEDENIPTLE